MDQAAIVSQLGAANHSHKDSAILKAPHDVKSTSQMETPHTQGSYTLSVQCVSTFTPSGGSKRTRELVGAPSWMYHPCLSVCLSVRLSIHGFVYHPTSCDGRVRAQDRGSLPRRPQRLQGLVGEAGVLRAGEVSANIHISDEHIDTNTDTSVAVSVGRYQDVLLCFVRREVSCMLYVCRDDSIRQLQLQGSLYSGEMH